MGVQALRGVAMIRAHYDPMTDSVVFYGRRVDDWGVEGDPKNAEVHREFPGERGSLSALMDDLWNMGVRPTASRYHSDQVAALQDHLADLRGITRHVLKMPETGHG